MYSTEQRKLAIETYIKFDLSAADTVAELGYPTRHSLRAWYKDYLEHGEVRPPKRQREPNFTLEMKQAAVDYYLAHGKGLARTMRKMGYPASREYLCGRTDDLALGQRKYKGPNPKAGPVPLGEKIQAVSELGSRNGTVAEAAAGTACRTRRPTYGAGRRWATMSGTSKRKAFPGAGNPTTCRTTSRCCRTCCERRRCSSGRCNSSSTCARRPSK